MKRRRKRRRNPSGGGTLKLFGLTLLGSFIGGAASWAAGLVTQNPGALGALRFVVVGLGGGWLGALASPGFGAGVFVVGLGGGLATWVAGASVAPSSGEKQLRRLRRAG